VSDTSKFDLFMDEIVSLEKMVQKFVADNQEMETNKSALSKKVDKLIQENEILVSKIKDLEKKIDHVDVDSGSVKSKTNLDLTEREDLKSQIDDLISRIDFHIRS
jgi:dynactin complex subunit